MKILVKQDIMDTQINNDNAVFTQILELYKQYEACLFKDEQRSLEIKSQILSLLPSSSLDVLIQSNFNLTLATKKQLLFVVFRICFTVDVPSCKQLLCYGRQKLDFTTFTHYINSIQNLSR